MIHTASYIVQGFPRAHNLNLKQSGSFQTLAYRQKDIKIHDFFKFLKSITKNLWAPVLQQIVCLFKININTKIDKTRLHRVKSQVSSRY